MEEAQRQRWRERLLQRRDLLLGSLAGHRNDGETVVLDQSRVGRLSRMDALQAQQLALEAVRRSEAELRRIDGALRRLDGGDFGHCFACGEAIAPRRLEADPTCTRCLSCADA